MNIQLLMTGNELMSGDIVDSNSAMLAQRLKDLGVEVTRKVTVADDFPLLVNEITQMAAQADVLIINGGLGPTSDDLTAQALATVAQVELQEHPQALAHVTSWCQKRGAKVNQPNLKQAILPAGADIIANSVGSAVGIKLNVNHCLVMCTPGVPRELSVMLEDEICPLISALLPEELHVHTTRYQVFGYGESSLQHLLAEQFPDWPKELEIGFRATMPLLELKITTRTHAQQLLKQQWLPRLIASLDSHIIHEITDKPTTLAYKLQTLLTEKKMTITAAESCTGGLIASLLTKEAGASNVFHAGFVTYHNESKAAVLGVDKTILEEKGAVSKETVEAMAKGALRVSGADLAIAVSGIAGPDGGSDDKPVGTVWIAWGDKAQINSVCLLIKANRWQFQQQVAAIGLDLIRRKLLGLKETPRYFIERNPQKNV